MARIFISSDSTCDLSPELIEKYGIHTIPLRVEHAGKLCSDGVDITPAEIFAAFKADGTLPKTAAITPADFEDYFRSLKAEGAEEIVHFSISSEFSCTHQNATLAALEVEGVHCIDSRNLSTGIGLQVLKAADMASAGKSADEICTEMARIADKVDASFILDTLAFLRAGGRCSSVAALSATVLNIKPCIVVDNGKMHASKKYMGSLGKALQKYAADRLAGVTVDRTRVFVTHTEMDPATVQSVKDIVAATGLFDEILETTAGCTVSAHCGPGCLGVLFIHE